VATAVKVGSEPAEHRRAPSRDEDAEEVLQGLLGYSRDRVADLRLDGAFGPSTAPATT
jgi:hypothetical protein